MQGPSVNATDTIERGGPHQPKMSAAGSFSKIDGHTAMDDSDDDKKFGHFAGYMKYDRKSHSRHGTGAMDVDNADGARGAGAGSGESRINAEDLLRKMDADVVHDSDDESDGMDDSDDDGAGHVSSNGSTTATGSGPRGAANSSSAASGTKAVGAGSAPSRSSSSSGMSDAAAPGIKRSASHGSEKGAGAGNSSAAPVPAGSGSVNGVTVQPPAAKRQELSESERAAKSQEWREKGNALYKAQEYADAVEAYTSAIEFAATKSASSVVHTNRAAAHFMMAAYGDAAGDCARAVHLDPENTKAYLRGAKAELARGNTEEAIRQYSKALERDPSDSTAKEEKMAAQKAHQRLAQAKGAMENGDYATAETMTNLLATPCPGATHIKLMRLDALIGLNKIDEAEKASKEMMTAAGKKDPAVLLARARVLHYSGSSGSAETHVAEALRLDPEFAPAARLKRAIRKAEDVKKRGNEAFKTANWQTAIDAYTECLELDPRNRVYNSRLYANRSSAWAKMGKHAESFEDASLAIEACDTWAKGYIRRAAAGLALADSEHLQGAVRDYNKAKELVEKEGDRDTLKEVEAGLKSAKAALKKAKRKDYYKILEVDKSAADEEIKKAYRKAALKWHPDRHANSEDQDKKKAESMFKDVNEAYSILSDTTKRGQYDAGMVPDGSGAMNYAHDSDDESPYGHGHSHGHGGFHGMHPGMRSGGFPGGGGMRFGGGGMGGGLDGIDPDIFASLFGGMMGGGMGGMPRGAGAPRGRR